MGILLGVLGKMKEMILDMGSGNTCKNDKKIVEDMIDAVCEIDRSKYRVIFKWQLFKSAPPNVPLEQEIFDYAYSYAAKKGYETTASIFDADNLIFLLRHDTPFIKIANNFKSAQQIIQIPTTHRVYSSFSFPFRAVLNHSYEEYVQFCVVSKYPAESWEYEKYFGWELRRAISDHTYNDHLVKIYNPDYYECHFVLEREASNPDAGLFARTPENLERIL